MPKYPNNDKLLQQADTALSNGGLLSPEQSRKFVELVTISLGEFLAQTRLERGLSLRQVERATGVSDSNLSQIENNIHGLSFKTAVKLCDFYGIKLDDIADTVRGSKELK